MKIITQHHKLPALPYAASALEPHIDARTMLLHHDMHHASYVKALNEALESAPQALREKAVDWLVLNPAQLPEAIRTTVRHNAGGHLNHSLFWLSMTPTSGSTPSTALRLAIDECFGSIESLRTRFEAAGAALFGSGWVWLVRTRDGSAPLKVLTTSGHDNPLTLGFYPLLVNDVWEHAYYLKHENRRAEYLKGWWSVANWSEASRRYEQPWQPATLQIGQSDVARLETTH